MLHLGCVGNASTIWMLLKLSVILVMRQHFLLCFLKTLLKGWLFLQMKMTRWTA